MHRFRPVGPDGPEPFTPGMVADWCDMTGTPLRSPERIILLEMDATFRSAWREEARNNNARREKSD